MTEQLPSDLLSRLRRYAEQNAREPWIPVKATELLMLIERIEQLQMPHSEVLRIAEVSDEGADSAAVMKALCQKAEAQRKRITQLEAKCDRLADTAMARSDR